MKKMSFPPLFKVSNSLGPLEYEVIRTVWDVDKITVRDVLLRFQKRKKVAYTTIMTVMDNLYKKSFLTREKVKKSYYYSAIAKENYLIKISVSGIFKNLAKNYGKVSVLYSAFNACMLPKINIAIISPASSKVIKTFRVPVGYGISLTLLLCLLGLSTYDLLQNLSFFGTNDYLGLVASDLIFSRDRLQPFALALFESIPIINLLTTAASFIMVVILAKKLANFFNFRIPISTNLGGAV